MLENIFTEVSLKSIEPKEQVMFKAFIYFESKTDVSATALEEIKKRLS